MTDDFLTPREVAHRLDVTTRTVQRWIADGRIGATRVGGRLRIPASALARDAGGPSPARATRPIRSLVIANRGEIARRVRRGARRLGLRVVAVHAADERPPDGYDAAARIPGYLDGTAIIAAARRHGADAIHPGYGFLAEDPAFAAAVIDAGLTWVGPPAAAIAAMGDKAAARRTASRAGVPVLPGYDGSSQDDGSLGAEAERIGYPLLVKPAAGGGGKGMRVVSEQVQLVDALAAARRESARAFGSERLILERYLSGPRHVEVQVLFDAYGRGVHLGERDCSAQRRNQKIVEESPAPSVSHELRRRMGDAALAVAAAVGYVNAGTVEFLLADDGRFYFLEMNTRLQVEHPVTEQVTGRDLVADQLRIAAGEPLGFEQDDVRFDGHAVEARLYAEDPEAGFLPATGRLLRIDWPSGPALRIDAGVDAGDVISDHYDPLLAKLIAHAPDRATALGRLAAGLQETRILGVRSNLRFLRWLLAQPFMVEGETRTDTLARVELPGPPIAADAAWRAAAAALAGQLGDGVWQGGWRLNAPPRFGLRSGDEERRVTPRNEAVAVETDGPVAHVDVDGQSIEFRLAPAPTVEEAVRHAAAGRDEAASLAAPMPGRVIAVRYAEGDPVEAHAVVVVIEAMKMEHAVVSPLAGTVVGVHVREGQQVQRGDPLAEVLAQ